jgi:hypothetical protein
MGTFKAEKSTPSKRFQSDENIVKKPSKPTRICLGKTRSIALVRKALFASPKSLDPAVHEVAKMPFSRFFDGHRFLSKEHPPLRPRKCVRPHKPRETR